MSRLPILSRTLSYSTRSSTFLKSVYYDDRTANPVLDKVRFRHRRTTVMFGNEAWAARFSFQFSTQCWNSLTPSQPDFQPQILTSRSKSQPVSSWPPRLTSGGWTSIPGSSFKLNPVFSVTEILRSKREFIRLHFLKLDDSQSTRPSSRAEQKRRLPPKVDVRNSVRRPFASIRPHGLSRP